MKDFVEAIIIMLDRHIITGREAHEIYVKAVANWFIDDIHHIDDEVN